MNLWLNCLQLSCIVGYIGARFWQVRRMHQRKRTESLILLQYQFNIVVEEQGQIGGVLFDCIISPAYWQHADVKHQPKKIPGNLEKVSPIHSLSSNEHGLHHWLIKKKSNNDISLAQKQTSFFKDPRGIVSVLCIEQAHYLVEQNKLVSVFLLDKLCNSDGASKWAQTNFWHSCTLVCCYFMVSIGQC